MSDLSTNGDCEVGAMTEGNIPDADKNKNCHYCIYGSDMLKRTIEKLSLSVHEKQIGKKVLEIRKKRRHFAIAPLCNDTTSLCNGYVAF